MYKLVFGIFAATFWLIAELINLYIQKLKTSDEAQQKANFKAVNDYFNRLVTSIKESKFLQLPFIAIKSFISLKKYTFDRIEKWLVKTNSGTSLNKKTGCLQSILIIIVALCVFLLVVTLIEGASSYPDCIEFNSITFCYPNEYGYQYAKFTFYTLEIILGIILLFSIEEKNFFSRILSTFGFLLMIVTPVVFIISLCVLLLDFSLALGIWYSVFPLIGFSFLIPYLLIQITAVVGSGFVGYDEDDSREDYIEKKKQNEEATKRFPEVIKNLAPAFPFLLSFFISFVLSSTSMMIGQLLVPIDESMIPLTVPMLFFNAIADGLTVIITIHILTKIISYKRISLFKIILFIILDIILAAILSVIAIMAGSLFENRGPIDFINAIELLSAYSFEHKEFRIDSGPYFFLIHTTFIPTIIYLIGILTLYFIKGVIYTPFLFFMKTVSENEQPLNLLALAIKVLARVFALIAALILLYNSFT